MEKYFKQIIALEILSLLYGFIHNFLYISQAFMYAAAFIAIMCSILLFWICFKSKILSKKEKTVGLIVASIPILTIVGAIIFVILLARATH